jgi:hypothetical protein
MIIQPKLTKKDIIKKVQDSTESNIYIYEPITTNSLNELISILRKLFTSNSYLSIIVVRNK